jgi:hypothetical protein
VSRLVPAPDGLTDAPRQSAVPARSDALRSFSRWESRLAELRGCFAAAEPFPHVVLDDVLPVDVYEQAAREFPSPGDSSWTNYFHVNERKYGNPRPDTWGPTLQSVARAYTTPRFVTFLEHLTGIERLLPDRTMDGGGLHQTPRGGYLNIHADFTTHHAVANWRRRVNVLVYFNDWWPSDWGGDLEFWARDMSRAVVKIAPRGNRMVVFNTDENSFHGHPDPLLCPDGVTRKSMALYYFTAESHPLIRSTNYQPRPGDGVKRATIYLDKSVLRAYDAVKRRWRLSDAIVSRLLGGGRRGNA